MLGTYELELQSTLLPRVSTELQDLRLLVLPNKELERCTTISANRTRSPNEPKMINREGLHREDEEKLVHETTTLAI